VNLRYLPLRPGSNIPWLEDWTNRASDDRSQWEAWARELPHCNWGVLVGNGVGVLDLDTKNAPEWSAGGFSSLINVQELLSVDLSNLPLVTTPHGAHLYFRYDEGLESRVPWIDHLDVKADGKEGRPGHQVAAPGSVRIDQHGIERTYTLIRGDLNDIPYAPLALIDAIRSWRGTSGHGSGGGGSAVELVSTEFRRENGFRLGERDNGFNTLVWSLTRKHYPHVDLIRQILYDVYAKTDNPNTDLFPWSKVEHQLARALKDIGPDVEAQNSWASGIRSIT
jgi:hypothetical protein